MPTGLWRADAAPWPHQRRFRFLRSSVDNLRFELAQGLHPNAVGVTYADIGKASMIESGKVLQVPLQQHTLFQLRSLGGSCNP